MTEPTAELTARVAAYIRGGAYPEVAAQAAGVPPGRLRRWLALGRKKEAGEAVRAFCQAVRQAEAVARLQAEVAALKAKPLDWLRHGPGRPRPDREGWTAAARAEPKAETPEPELPWELARQLVERLEPWPEARVAIAAWLACPGGEPDRSIQVYTSEGERRGNEHDRPEGGRREETARGACPADGESGATAGAAAVPALRGQAAGEPAGPVRGMRGEAGDTAHPHPPVALDLRVGGEVEGLGRTGPAGEGTVHPAGG